MNSLAALQEKILDQHMPLADVLRQAKVVATALRNPEFAAWVDQELNGYDTPRDNLPDYRKFRAHNVGDLMGPGAEWKNAPLMTSQLAEPMRSQLEYMLIVEDVGTLEYMLADGRTDDLQKPWPPEYIAASSNKFFQGLHCVAAHQVVSAACIKHVLEVVRNRLLGFVLELQTKHPEAAETDKSLASVPLDDSKTIFNTYILGDGNTTSVGQQSSATAVESIKVNDLDSLAAFMKAAGIPAESVGDLVQSVKDDSLPPDATAVGTNVGSWITRTAKQLASGALKLAGAVTAEIIVKAISAYYGWH